MSYLALHLVVPSNTVQCDICKAYCRSEHVRRTPEVEGGDWIYICNDCDEPCSDAEDDTEKG